MNGFNHLLDKLSNFFAARKGLLPIIGLLLIAINLFLQIFSGSWLAESDLFLHLGAIIAIFGFMLAWAL